MRAYDVQLDQIIAPAWIMDNMGPNLYQIDAAIPPETTKAQFQLMMRNLLAERFHLQVHHETHHFPGYNLVVAKDGPKFQASAPDPNAAAEPQMKTSLGRGMIRVQAREKPIGDLIAGMGRLIAQSQGGDPADFASPKARVIDKTGLTGKYDFTLEFSCEGCRSLGANAPWATTPADPAGSGLPDIFAALEKQLGLRLVKTKDIPLDVVVVDHADRIPTGN